ncbi:Glu/Leu/Phe/Val dehydrogenase [Deinococcus irradiatisoli]|uniref:Glu/Leu/Phe/Val dehydrogenase n=1 Tax=Deinococcus irradiatisoli TaxID=2202254 RepID=A0A2Z3JAZ7_9DEIO|nr:Glu/Leu/Phe/Val dehydrogenase dimerization domain-containing protein [Deinococcus irradiatisoli]AWN22293.1 Glu/Leu/Phe/Val dehydrogenase [Deinococcus irradiatisoli]
MLMFDEMQGRGHEQVTLLSHAASGLRAVLTIHSTVLGPAIAGCRLVTVEEDLAIKGALALSESMTLKAALTGLNYGGASCVLLSPDTLLAEEGGDAQGHAREALFRALGRQISHFGGRVILTEDVRVSGQDIAYVAQETSSTMGMNTDTAAATAYGVYRGIKAAARFTLGSESMRNVRVAILGVGTVGRLLAGYLHREGARLSVADAHPERAEELADELEHVQVLGVEELIDSPCDVLAPCAFGYSIRSQDIPRLQCRLIAGAEHHPLSRTSEELVREAGITYIPDFAINGAGLIASARHLTPEQAGEQIYTIVSRITALAEQHHKPPHRVARKMAERRLELIGSLGRA